MVKVQDHNVVSSIAKPGLRITINEITTTEYSKSCVINLGSLSGISQSGRLIGVCNSDDDYFRYSVYNLTNSLQM